MTFKYWDILHGKPSHSWQLRRHTVAVGHLYLTLYDGSNLKMNIDKRVGN